MKSQKSSEFKLDMKKMGKIMEIDHHMKNLIATLDEPTQTKTNLWPKFNPSKCLSDGLSAL